MKTEPDQRDKVPVPEEDWENAIQIMIQQTMTKVAEEVLVKKPDEEEVVDKGKVWDKDVAELTINPSEV
jgi:hypothetical protein